jgi:hypothetical protein
MTELISVETNCETGETITRPYTAEEVAAYEAASAEAVALRAEQEAIAEAKAAAKASAEAKLAALGLTAEEIAAL